jgi:chemotaxis protein methyltransferase CheR
MFASDINTQVLEKAREGIYKKEFMEYVPADFLLKFFDTKSLLPRDAVQVKSDVRAMIKFIKLNLVQDAYLFPFKFDIIFCRNVMIYFPQSVVLETMRKLAGCLDKKGFLFIGHSETMVGDKLSLKSIVPAVYQHK